jgi:hypothetical protein
LDVYGPSLYSVNICIIGYSVLIYKVLFITYSRLLKGTYINYNTIEFLKYIVFSSNVYKGVLFLVYKVYNGSNKYTYRWVFKCN